MSTSLDITQPSATKITTLSTSTTSTLSRLPQIFTIRSSGDLDSDLAEKVQPLYGGDLCELALKDETKCIGAVRKKMKNGLITANALMIDSVTTIKRSYEISNKTHEAIKELLYTQEIIDIEYAYWFYIPPTTSIIQDAMFEMVMRTIDGAKKTLSTTIFVCVGAFAVFFLIMWRALWAKLMDERMMVPNMVKMIPQNVTITNFYVKNFLLKLSQNRL